MKHIRLVIETTSDRTFRGDPIKMENDAADQYLEDFSRRDGKTFIMAQYIALMINGVEIFFRGEHIVAVWVDVSVTPEEF